MLNGAVVGFGHADEFRRCLTELDVAGAMRLWAHVSPHLPQPRHGVDALIMLHRARTQAQSIAFWLRAYSHSWLLERGLPSGLPDDLKPKAQRLYPVIVSAVGIAVAAPRDASAARKEEAKAIHNAMSNVVLEAYADGVRDPVTIRSRMMEARKKF